MLTIIKVATMRFDLRVRNGLLPADIGFLLVSVGCRQQSNETKKGDASMSIELTSTAFKAETSIPKQYTGDGADQSPPLHWSDPPAGTKSIALICDDPDAPRTTWVHWVLFNLPSSPVNWKKACRQQQRSATGQARKK